MSKSRENSRVGGRSSGIALLAVSTIVLAAAGETMWHANASANASEGRWAAPGIGSAAAGVSTPAAIISEAALASERAEAATAETEGEVESMTTPIFKPFVMVRIPLPSGYTHGEVLGLNNSNQAVGWMWNDSAEIANAFFFDPEEGVTILDTDEVNMDAAWAYAISDETPPTIAGVVIWKDEPDYQRAALWDGSDDEAYVPFGTGVVSAAYSVKGVSSASTLAGMYVVSSEERSVVYVEGSGASYPASGVNGEARALNESGKVVGWHMVSSASHAYSWSSNTTSDIHPSGYDASSALCVNSTGHIGGWVDDDGEILPALWTPLFFGVYTTEPFDDAGADAAVTAINSHGEMAIMRTDATPGVAIWSKRSGVDHADLLSNMTLTRSGMDVLNSAWAINDNGWIGGSYLAGGTGDPQPCLIIPYDVDNNGTPDYREILEGKREGHTDLDTDGNWLLDAAEVMRVGLHAPGPPNSPEGGLDPVQVVRTRINVKPRGAAGPEGLPDEIYIDEIVASTPDCEACQNFTEYVDGWGTGSARPSPATDEQSEIIARVHSLMGENDEDWGDHEGLPENETVRLQALEDIHSFGYRFARCLDWLQWGNESYGGAAGYKFRHDDLIDPDEIITGCTWQQEGVYLDFQQVGNQLGSSCQGLALRLVLDWQVEQMWAALEGSALAGRPLRMTSAGVAMISVRNGYDCQSHPVGCNLVSRVSEMCNANQMYFAQHMHYEDIDHVSETIEKLTGTGNFTSPPWDVPNWRVCTELGAAALFTDDWWTDNDQYWFNQYLDYFFENRSAPDFFWEEFIDEWAGIGELAGQFDDGIELDSVLNSLAAGGFVTACHSALQFDSGLVTAPSRHQVEGLRATQLLNPETMTERQYLFTPVADWYLDQYAAPAHKIQNFSPHPSACDPNHTCPGCP